MPATLIATYGANDANTYLTLVDADTFITSYLLDNQPWADASTEKRTIALLQATRTIDAHNFHGARYFYKQALAFPRVPPDVDLGGYPRFGTMQPDQTFFNFLEQDEYLKKQQTRVLNACAIQAVFTLRNAGRNLEREAQSLGIGSQSSGSAGVSESQSYVAAGYRLHPDALDLLRRYRQAPRVVRGSGPDPTFE